MTSEHRQLADFLGLIEIQQRGEYTLADRQLLAVIMARDETRNAPLSGEIRRHGP